MKVSIGNLIDRLSIINIKIFFLENIKRDKNKSDTEISDATRQTNDLNVERNLLTEEIDIALNDIAMGERQQIFGSNKMYGNEKR